MDDSAACLNAENNSVGSCEKIISTTTTYFDENDAKIMNSELTLYDRSHNAISWIEKQQIVKQAFDHAWRSVSQNQKQKSFYLF